MSLSGSLSTRQYPKLEEQFYDKQHTLQTVSICFPRPFSEGGIKSGYWVM
jgi:hypothetical protein